MFGMKKKKLEMKSVEEYVKGESRPDPVSEAEMATESDGQRFKLTPYIPAAIAVVVIVAVVIVVFSKINSLGTAVDQLRTEIKESGDVQTLKSQVSSVQSKLQASGKDAEQLRQQIARLDRELDAAKAQLARIEAIAKKPPSPQEKRKPAKPRT